MNKALAWLTTVVLSGFCLSAIFGLVVALDEFARIPFYRTLSLAAGLVNGIALFLFWRRGARIEMAGAIYSRIASGMRAVSRPAPAAVDGLKLDNNRHATVPHAHGSFNQTQAGEVSAAVAKIHSVAWLFRASAGSVPVDTQETMNHEAYS